MSIKIPENGNIILYTTDDGKSQIALYSRDGRVWLNQNQISDLFATSKQNVSFHILNILKEGELQEFSVVKDFLTTGPDGKNYNVQYYSLEMILAIGFRVHSIRGTQFRQWALRNLSEFLVKKTENRKFAILGMPVDCVHFPSVPGSRFRTTFPRR